MLSGEQLLDKTLSKNDRVTEVLLDTAEAFSVERKNQDDIWLKRGLRTGDRI